MIRLRACAALLPALACLLGSAPAPAQEPLGRLFLSPAQRAQLEQARRAPPLAAQPAPTQSDPEPPAAPPPAEVPRIVVQGVVQRSDGRSVAWVNGMSTLSGDFAAQHFDVRVRGPDAVELDLPEHLPDVTLKPGQAYVPEESRILDATIVPPAPP